MGGAWCNTLAQSSLKPMPPRLYNTTSSNVCLFIHIGINFSFFVIVLHLPVLSVNINSSIDCRRRQNPLISNWGFKHPDRMSFTSGMAILIAKRCLLIFFFSNVNAHVHCDYVHHQRSLKIKRLIELLIELLLKVTEGRN